ncbi:MAG: hypothetical protein IJ867_05735 [Clostridia bacterium]|nr:hypothetical protein [Clostridia bacterium]
MDLQTNNVLVSGNIMEEFPISPKTTRLEVGAKANGNIVVTIPVLISTEQWESFKEDYPEKYESVTISGHLDSAYKENSDNIPYVIKTGKNSITCFHHMLDNYIDESKIQFSGIVKLLEKSDLSKDSELILRWLTLETTTKYPTVFKAVALRKIAPDLNKVKAGTNLWVKANLVQDKETYQPYWRLKNFAVL